MLSPLCIANPAKSSLVALLARGRQQHSALTQLHGLALALSGGDRSLLFEHNPATGALQVTSARGVSQVPAEQWSPAFTTRRTSRWRSAPKASSPWTASAQMPQLFSRLGSGPRC